VQKRGGMGEGGGVQVGEKKKEKLTFKRLEKIGKKNYVLLEIKNHWWGKPGGPRHYKPTTKKGTRGGGRKKGFDVKGNGEEKGGNFNRWGNSFCFFGGKRKPRQGAFRGGGGILESGQVEGKGGT